MHPLLQAFVVAALLAGACIALAHVATYIQRRYFDGR